MQHCALTLPENKTLSEIFTHEDALRNENEIIIILRVAGLFKLNMSCGCLYVMGKVIVFIALKFVIYKNNNKC